MLVSYQWLQSFFNGALPEPEIVSHALMFGAFEVENVEQQKDDTIFDIKVLPNRAHDCLSHRGIARELSVLLQIPLTRDPLRATHAYVPVSEKVLHINADFSRTSLYAAARITGISVGPSPEWLSKRLEAIGQRSINTIVDATNYVMFELGTPLHAFDAKKLEQKGEISISVREAKEGERITLLGGTEVALTPEASVIANAHTNEAIAIAGVKGGALAEIELETTDVILEAANFDPIRTRKVAQKLNLRTDASKRFENGIADDLALYGLKEVAKLIREIAGGELTSLSCVRARETPPPYTLGISVQEVNGSLGTDLNSDDMANVLTKLQFTHERVDALSHVLDAARNFEGVPYKLGSSVRFDAPRTFDCSSFTAWLFAQAGIAIPRVSVDQYLWGEPVDASALEAGDLVFSNTGIKHIWFESHAFIKGKKVPEGVDHVGLYLGDNTVIHAAGGEIGKVVIEKLSESERFRHIVGYRRIVPKTDIRFVISVPFERIDVRISADLIEEIARVWGYDRVPAVPLERDMEVMVEQGFFAAETARAALMQAGFSEIYTYALGEAGAVLLLNPFAADKKALRADLSSTLERALTMNKPFAPLLEVKQLCLFEIGTVFPSPTEEAIHLAIAAEKVPDLERGMQAVQEVLGVSWERNRNVAECDLRTVNPTSKRSYPDIPSIDSERSYAPISPYPFVLRDIALWVPQEASQEEVRALILDRGGPLLIRVECFDEFKKEERISYAYHLVFQSTERTLTDEEVGAIMQEMGKGMRARGWEVR